MPASPSFPPDNCGRWKKRKEPQNTRKPKPDDEEEDEDEELEQEDEEEPRAPHSVPQSAPPAPLSGPIAREFEVLSDGGTRICDFPVVVRHTVNRPHFSVLGIVSLDRATQCGDSRSQTTNPIVLENISYGQLQALSAVPVDSPSLAAGDQDSVDGGTAFGYVITPPQIMEGCGVVKRFGSNRVLVLPMHADWFSPVTVHRLERQVVPHFFSGKSPDHTPERYLDCRNLIVAKYMEKPEKRLSVTDCQAVMIDIDDLTRIFRFLEHWGIINYCAAAPKHDPCHRGSYLTEDLNGEVHVPSSALKSIESLVQFDRPKCRLKAAEVYPSMLSPGEPDLDSRIRERLSEHCCTHCSLPIPLVCYQSQKEVDVLLCSDCFHEGRFVVGHSSIDFVRTETARDYGDTDGEAWTDQETLLLLEAVEIYNDNWNEIAEHVGSKSKAQCILHFICLPTDYSLMENIEVPGMPRTHPCGREDFGPSHITSNGNSAGSVLLDPNSRLPFANCGNPVMSLVAFLASAVGPRVAAACAHASLAALSEDDSRAASGNSMQMEGSGRGDRMNFGSSSFKDGGSCGNAANLNQQRGPWHQNDGEAAPLSREKVKNAAKVGLSAAAMKTKLFADHEEREIQRLSANIINHQLKRLELKLKQFAEVETLLIRECEQVERARQRLGAERGRIISVGAGPSGPPTASTRLPSQSPMPLIHPHMSFVQRPQMFGLGQQRLPTPAITPSPSSASNSVMFNAQPALTHPMLRPTSGLG